MDYFLEKLPLPPWGTTVSQRIEVTIKFFSMTQEAFEIDAMVYNMTKNPRIYIKKFPIYGPWKLIMA